MLYDCLKIIHILSASLFITSLAYCAYLWFQHRSPRAAAYASERIQTQTHLIIIPTALFQLATGFTLMSLKQHDLTLAWISASVIGFVLVISTWFLFLYYLLQAQFIYIHNRKLQFSAEKYRYFRRTQSTLLSICLSSLLGMIFLMSNMTAKF